MTQMTADVVVVVDPDLMDDDVFIKHMNARHAPLVTQRGAALTSYLLGTDIAVLRAFHRRAHEIGVPNNAVTGHVHRHGDMESA